MKRLNDDDMAQDTDREGQVKENELVSSQYCYMSKKKYTKQYGFGHRNSDKGLNTCIRNRYYTHICIQIYTRMRASVMAFYMKYDHKIQAAA